MNAVRLDAEGDEVDRRSLLAVILQLSQLLETFLLSSCPHFSSDSGTLFPPPPSPPLSHTHTHTHTHTPDPEELEGQLHKLSLTMEMKLNRFHCSSEVCVTPIPFQCITIPFHSFSSTTWPC